MNGSQSSRQEREEMVVRQIEGRDIRDPHVLRAMREVPREEFLSPSRRHLAYADAAFPIEEGQTISQPFIVALMASSLNLEAGDRVLEIGTGSGYAAAVMGVIAREVYTVERHAQLAEAARARLHQLGYTNLHVGHGDGTVGWQEHAPYDAISVAASGPQVPESLLSQLRVGGRLVMPVGATREEQRLVRVTRTGPAEYNREDLGPVAFVPLIGKEGWESDESAGAPPVSVLGRPEQVARMIAEAAEPFQLIEDADLSGLMDRIGDARVVLIGEATHGTAEFYRMRQCITAHLILHKGFTIIGAEADWPDAARVNSYVRGASTSRRVAQIFSRFPLWMWRNREVLDFVEWLRTYNASQPAETQAGFYGLDLYSLHDSIHEVLHYLEGVDPETARIARARYECLTPYARDPADYGVAALTGQGETCEDEAVAMLSDLLKRRLQYAHEGGEQFFDAVQNAAIVASAEKYYRVMYHGAAEAWNLRDRHMFDTLDALLAHYGPQSKAVVWAHNSHIGDAAATEMSARGEINIGHLARRKYGDAAYLIGFGTDHGTVAAASQWGGEVETISVTPAREGSYERLCHESGVPRFFLPLRHATRENMLAELLTSRLERAIGVIYRPQTELLSHYFQAVLPEQFDEYVWFDETHGVTPLGHPHAPQLEQGHPFALLDA